MIPNSPGKENEDDNNNNENLLKEFGKLDIKIAQIQGKYAAADAMKTKFPNVSKLNEDFQKIEKIWNALTKEKDGLVMLLNYKDPVFEPLKYVTDKLRAICAESQKKYIEKVEKENPRKITKYDNLSNDSLVENFQVLLSSLVPVAASFKVLKSLHNKNTEGLSFRRRVLGFEEKR